MRKSPKSCEYAYADDFQNAVFVRHEMVDSQWRRGDITGASMRGTWSEQHPFRGMAPGTVRDKGWFWLGTGRGQISRVMLTESPIDTMSLAMLDKQSRTQSGVTIYLSVDGSGALPVEALRAVMQRGGKVNIAFDADKPGELMSWRVAQQLPGTERLWPRRSKDWNDQLTGTQQTVSQKYEHGLSTVWKWHQAAFLIERSEPYLNRIAEVAISYVKGESLSDRAREAMAKDFGQIAAKTPCYESIGQDR